MYDHFMAAMRCPNCGEISAVDDSTGMQTHLRDPPDASFFRVGDKFAFNRAGAVASGYLEIQPMPNADHPVHIGQMWECPNCGNPNWAEVVVDKDVIKSIDTIALDQSALERLHILDDQASYYIAANAKRDVGEAWPELVPLLRDYLAIPGNKF